MSNFEHLKYIEPGQLSVLLSEKSIAARSSEDGSDEILILDVRGEEEFAESGHINGAINAPSTQWTDEQFIEELFEKHVVGADSKKRIVCHCAHSKQRGPTCAQLLENRIQKFVSEAGADAPDVPQVLVLKGGFVGFEESTDKELNHITK